MKLNSLWASLFIFLILGSLPLHAEVAVEDSILQGRIDFLNGKSAKINGPNCWNAATYVAGLSRGIHHTVGSEFAFLLESPLCQNVPLENMQKGDIVALRRFDSKGRLLPWAMLSEVHGYTYLGNGMGFTKNGVEMSAPYQMQSRADILDFYKSSERRNCKINGLDFKNCNLRETAYRCTDFETYMKSQGGLKPLEKNVLQKLTWFEQHLQAQVLFGQALNFNKDKALEELTQDIENLKSQKSSEFVTDYFEMRLESLSFVFTNQ